VSVSRVGVLGLARIAPLPLVKGCSSLGSFYPFLA
jgi:hypothetical protein